MTKRDDLTEEERKQIRNEFQKWGKWMLATILLIVGLVIYDANSQNVPPTVADNMEMVEVCKWKGRISHMMSTIYIEEGEANNLNRDSIHFFMGRPATPFEQSIIDDALKKVNELLDEGLTNSSQIAQLIAGECMKSLEKGLENTI